MAMADMNEVCSCCERRLNKLVADEFCAEDCIVTWIFDRGEIHHTWAQYKSRRCQLDDLLAGIYIHIYHKREGFECSINFYCSDVYEGTLVALEILPSFPIW